MPLLDLIAAVIVVTVSGAMAPGPLFFATILEGARSGAKAGLIFSLGHALVELPLILVLALGFVSISQPAVKVVVGMLGGVFLLFFGFQQMKDAFGSGPPEQRPGKLKQRGLFITGLALSALNPFFIVWWLTVGSKLILDALAYASLGGVLILFISHIWIDFACLGFVAYSAMKGRSLLGSKGYRLLLCLSGLAVMVLGLTFLSTAFGG